MRCGTLDLVPTATEPTDPEASASGRGEVVLVVGNGQLIVHVITRDEVVIGRAEGCDLVLDHRALSRRHAVLRRMIGGWELAGGHVPDRPNGAAR